METQSTPSPAPSNNSEQPVELDFQAPVETQPTTSPIPAEQIQPIVPPVPVPTPTQPTPQPQTQPSEPSPSPTTAPAGRRIVEVTSDRQEYDEQRQIVTAEGNVIVRFDGAVLDADRLQVNLPNLIAVGEGNVALTRGQQVLRGERFTYNFVQDLGISRMAVAKFSSPQRVLISLALYPLMSLLAGYRSDHPAIA